MSDSLAVEWPATTCLCWNHTPAQPHSANCIQCHYTLITPVSKTVATTRVAFLRIERITRPCQQRNRPSLTTRRLVHGSGQERTRIPVHNVRNVTEKGIFLILIDELPPIASCVMFLFIMQCSPEFRRLPSLRSLCHCQGNITLTREDRLGPSSAIPRQRQQGRWYWENTYWMFLV